MPLKIRPSFVVWQPARTLARSRTFLTTQAMGPTQQQGQALLDNLCPKRDQSLDHFPLFQSLQSRFVGHSLSRLEPHLLRHQIAQVPHPLPRAVKTIQTQEPLNAVGLHGNGHILAAGGMYGALLLYDLRMPSKVKEKLIGHETGIKQLEFFKSREKENNGEKTAPNRSSAVLPSENKI